MKTIILIALLIISSALPHQTHAAAGDESIVYRPLTRATLSQLYWKEDLLDINSDHDIDNFLLINKCSLYKENFSKDFEWHEIRKNARASLLKHKDKFSKHIEFTQLIWLGRYNVADQTFPLLSPIDTTVFEIEAKDTDSWECKDETKYQGVWRYPHKAIVSFPYKLSIEKIYVPTEIAEEYNNIYQNLYSKHDKRPAYITQKIRIFDASLDSRQYNYKNTATLDAILERVEIHADKKRKLLLYAEDKRIRKSQQTSD